MTGDHALPVRVPTPRHYLMCPPRHFAVEYSINPWMDPDQPVDAELAMRQWTTLRDTYRELGHTVDEVPPQPGLPDMVFAANSGTVVDGRVLGSRFRAPERAAEAEHFRRWFVENGFRDVTMPRQINEAEGDFVWTGRVLLAGTGFRTDPGAHAEAQEALGVPAVSLQLVDERYYHLDTALFVLSGDTAGAGPVDAGAGGGAGAEVDAGVAASGARVADSGARVAAPGGRVAGSGAGGGAGVGSRAQIAYYPEAFSAGSRRVLRRLFPDAVIATKADAECFGLNGISDGRHVVLPIEATGLAERLTARGYEVRFVDISELRKAGGGPKCCTLEIRK
ncbi:N-dimethylarginine dimethylaminohydrolase [Prauserella sediminis]|uniref:N-dimethylarginine dimethylaminohydrolase n=2 Tax=Prauserella sediminis TaxID=577680 RepID=A0A839XG26_9PSEU|nr:amidinotransferase [Prauserella sediminis]MBB3662230.1 N-dimethylarginine dimethylaminohydrolase [Prauserella sediminis]